jgi:hypothetical protein
MRSLSGMKIGLAVALMLSVGLTAKAVTLQDLITKSYNGGVITSGNLTFSNFSFTATSLPSNVSTSDVENNMTVLPYANPTGSGLDFNMMPQSNIFWFLTNLAENNANISWSYDVQSDQIYSNALTYGWIMTGEYGGQSGKGSVDFTENVTSNNNPVSSLPLNDSVTTTVNGNTTYLSASSPLVPAPAHYSPYSLLHVDNSLSFSSSNAAITYGNIDQTFVPEPGALTMLFGSGICGSLFFLRKRSVA